MSEATELPRLLTMKEVIGLLRVNRSTVDRWISEGKFVTPVRIGGAVQRFERDDVLQFIAASKSTEPMEARRRRARIVPRRTKADKKTARRGD